MERWPAGVGLTEVAQAYIDRWSHGGDGRRETVSSLADAELRWDEGYCRRVAEYFDHAPLLVHDERLARRYNRFQQENLEQYQAIRDTGIAVRPWLAPGQPYRRAADLRSSVRSSGVLHVYLTSDGHGPDSGRGHHPMREPSGIVVDDVEFSHNDVFRAVHDIFGHVLPGNSFSARGELKASFWQMWMYSADVHPVLFTEQIAQTCWFFVGPHLAAGGRRRYPDQKVFEFPRHFLDEFMDLFAAGRTEEST